MALGLSIRDGGRLVEAQQIALGFADVKNDPPICTGTSGVSQMRAKCLLQGFFASIRGEVQLVGLDVVRQELRIFRREVVRFSPAAFPVTHLGVGAERKGEVPHLNALRELSGSRLRIPDQWPAISTEGTVCHARGQCQQ